MNILLLGSGGRESALAWKIAQSRDTDKLYIAPGNGGTSKYGQNIDLSPLDFEKIRNFVEEHAIKMIVVGNEDPLVAGIRDFFASSEILIVGPGRDGAMLEGSKDFAKRFMKRHGISTARYQSFTKGNINDAYTFLSSLNPPYVLKADGLAAGKGVIIIDDLNEAKNALKEMLDGQFGDSSKTVVIEEFLKGIECSIFVLTDGKGNYLTLPVAKDYKRRLENDKGLNTGGMGAVSPVSFADNIFMKKVQEKIITPTIQGLIADKIDYRGFIFFGLINVDGEPMVIEYNSRMGDPETEAVMMRIQSELTPLLIKCAQGDLSGCTIDIDPMSAATVIAVAKGYPGHYEKGKIINLPSTLPQDVQIFQAGTKFKDGHLITNGGRVIAISALGSDIQEAVRKCYKTLEHIYFEGIDYRRDIGKDLS